MPDLKFDVKNKTASVFDIERLKLSKDEVARIVLIDDGVRMEISHYIKAGEFGNYYLCLGEPSVIKESQIDPDRCPACKIAEPGQAAIVGMPRRRFAMHIGRYQTNFRGQVMSKVPNLLLQVWVFGDDKYNKLTDRQESHGDLRLKDITLKCTGAQYQNFDFDILDSFLSKEDAKENGLLEQYKDIQTQRSSELTRLLGQNLPFEKLQHLINGANPVITEEEIDNETKQAVSDVMGEIESLPFDNPLPSGPGLDSILEVESSNEGLDIILVQSDTVSKEALNLDALLGLGA